MLAALAVAVASSITAWCRTRDPAGPSESAADVEARVRATCGNCHPFPTPDILPRSAWRDMIQHMASLRRVLRERSFSRGFSLDEVAEWYESRALDELPVEFRLSRDEPGPLRFSRRMIPLGPDSGPGIATVQRLGSGLIPDIDYVLALPNMANGSIHFFNLQRGARRIAAVEHPARVVSGDLDGDGLPDLLISDLGDPMPTDELVGRLVIGINGGDGEFALQTVLDGVGRVADARPVDLDADGDLD
ncbi:MAG: FG-GAP repeat domain-containing protein, partial [Planctomycetota bacterium]